MNIERALDRMAIGDSAVSGSVRVDFLHADESIEPCYAVCTGSRILFLNAVSGIAIYSKRNSAHRDSLLRYMSAPDRGLTALSDWRVVEGGSESNPLWETGIGNLTVPDAEWFFSPSPHTGSRRVWAATLCRHVSNLEFKDGDIAALEMRQGALQRESRAAITQRLVLHGVYRMHSRLTRNIGNVQITSIHEQPVAALIDQPSPFGYRDSSDFLHSLPPAWTQTSFLPAYTVEFCPIENA